MIYTPLSMIDLAARASDGHKQLCTKIVIGGFEISIAMDQSFCKGDDLSRAEIRIYTGSTRQGDVTQHFIDQYKADTGVEVNVFCLPQHLAWILNSAMEKQ